MPSGPPDEVIVVEDSSWAAESALLARMFESSIHIYRTEQGEQASGGCEFGPERWRCKHCGHAW